MKGISKFLPIFVVLAMALSAFSVNAVYASGSPSANPSSVTGGGWIESQAGSYMPLPAGETIITSADLGQNWVKATKETGTGDFETGPGTPPLGTGSFHMSTSGSSDKVTLFNYGYIGVPLSDVSAISYATYRDGSSTNSPAQYPSINLEVDFKGDGASYTTLVWEPIYAYGQSNLKVDTWQTWDTMATSQTGYGGGWWSTKDIPGVCAFNCFVSWDTIRSNNPDAKIVGGFGVDVGSGWSGTFSGAVDALSITVNGTQTTYNFEASAPPEPTGKANFGFVAQPGTNSPGGNLEFSFPAANLDLHSTSYTSLTFDQNVADIQGSGTINGEQAPNGEPYQFTARAGDRAGANGADTFRIQIWYGSGSQKVVVYDNGSDQAIGSGSIVIH